LWDRVRVQGGAYGSSISFDYYTGDLGLVSYRDPNLTETLEVYDQIADFLDQLDLTQDELEKIIIGCVGNLDPPLSPDRKGAISKVEALTGLTQELKQKRLEEILATTVEDIKGFGDMFRQVRDTGRVCVLGGEAKIKKAAHRFDHLCPVFN
jgi:Zn-dependent M16 (insulinase) family peptidase